MTCINKSLIICVLILLISEKPGINGARILGILPLTSRSHFVMGETLMRGLAAQGHQVDVVSHHPLKNSPPNYRDISLAGTAPESTNSLTLDKINFMSNSGLIYMMHTFAGLPVCQLINQPQLRNILDNPPNDPPYDVVIVEMFIADCYVAFGRHLKIPVVGLVMSKIFDWMHEPLGNPPNAAFVPSIFSDFSQNMNFLERLENTVMSKIRVAQYWYYSEPQVAFVNENFNFNISSTRELYNDISVILVNTHPSLDSVKPMTPGIIEVGGLHVDDGDDNFSPEVKKWLDDSNQGCIYFSFGSMMKIESFPRETIEAFYTGIERISPVRVLMKIAKKEELPAGLPKNVLTSSWLPQTRVLKHKNIKAFVTHGGLMSNIEAVTYGVPMISIPIFGDQPLNARFNEKNKIGITVDYNTVTADSFTRSLKTILEDTYRQKSKQMAELYADRPMTPLKTAIFWIEYVIRNGNVLKSPAAELSWWQIQLFDVYGFLIAIVLLTLYVVNRLITFMINILCRNSSKQENKSKNDCKSKHGAESKKRK